MTLTLVSVKPFHNNTFAVTVREDGGEKPKKRHFLAEGADYIEAGSPKAGDILFPEDYTVLRRRIDKQRAVERVYTILSFGDNTEDVLFRKLLQKGFPEAAARYAVDTAKERGLLREKEALIRFITDTAERKLYGKRRIYAAALQKGFKSYEIEATLSELSESGELDFTELKRRLIEKRSPLSAEERKKLLYRHGF